MQVTIHRFSADRRTGLVTGSVITDEGLVLPLLPTALLASELRHLRVGQRVTVVMATQEVLPGVYPVERISLGTIGSPPGPPSVP